MSKSVSILLCLTALLARGLWADESVEQNKDDKVIVNVVGTLKTGLVAIGGETTGTVVRSKGITWELEFAKNSELNKAAAQLSGQRVTVEGDLEHRSGVEVKERWIITVTKLHAVK